MAKTPLHRALTGDERRCLEQLEDWEEEIRDLLTFIGPATSVARDKDEPTSGPWATEARTRLTSLKRDLGVEARRLAVGEQRRELNDAESRYYAPTIQQASAYLTLNARSTNGEEWRQQLGPALTTIGYPLSQLKAQRDASQKTTKGGV
jgi:hypothetical protein